MTDHLTEIVLQEVIAERDEAQRQVTRMRDALQDCLLALDSLHDSPVLKTAAATARAALEARRTPTGDGSPADRNTT